MRNLLLLRYFINNVIYHLKGIIINNREMRFYNLRDNFSLIYYIVKYV